MAIDAKRAILRPERFLALSELVAAQARSWEASAVGGMTMGADPIALSIGIAAQLENPANTLRVFNVRKEPKKHGLRKNIEGNFTANDTVVVVDDVHREERVVTVYEPASDRWSDDYRRRR